MRARIRNFATDASGATAIEYGMIALGIAVAIVASVETVGNSVNGIFGNVSAGFN